MHVACGPGGLRQEGPRGPLQRPAHPVDPSPPPFPPCPRHSFGEDFPLLMVSEQQLTIGAGLCKAHRLPAAASR